MRLVSTPFEGKRIRRATEFEHAGGRFVVGAAVADYLDADMNAAVTEFDDMVIREDTMTHHSNEIANASDVETVQAENRLVAVETATRNRGENTNATAAKCDLSEDSNAAAAKEFARRREFMSKSQENNEKTSEGDDEIRRLVEERRNTAKGEKHKLKDFEQEDQKMYQGKKKNKTTRNDTTDSGIIERHQKNIMNKFWKDMNAFPKCEKRHRRDNHNQTSNCKCLW